MKCSAILKVPVSSELVSDVQRCRKVIKQTKIAALTICSELKRFNRKWNDSNLLIDDVFRACQAEIKRFKKITSGDLALEDPESEYLFDDRSSRYSVRFTTEEKHKIKACTNKLGLSVSSFLGDIAYEIFDKEYNIENLIVNFKIKLSLMKHYKQKRYTLPMSKINIYRELMLRSTYCKSTKINTLLYEFNKKHPIQSE